MDERSFQRLLRRTVAIPVALLVLLAAVLVAEILYLTASLRKVDSTLEVISNARSLLRYMIDMESSIRGFYLTGKPEYLAPYVADKTAVSQELALLGELTADTPDQHQRVEELRDLDRRWIDYADHSLAEPAAQRTQEEFENAKHLMDRIHAVHTEVLDAEYAIGVTRERRATFLNRVVLATAVGLSLLIAVILFTTTRRELRRLSSTYEAHLQAEEEKSRQLAESRERFQITLNSLGDAVIATGAEGLVRYINPVAQQLTGWEDYMEARGRPLREVARLIDERSREPLTDPVEAVRQAAKVIGLSDHILLASRSGQEYPVEMTGAPILNETGELTGVVVVFRDVTQRRQTEQTLQASDRLTQVGRLAATIAHEIRNPLDTVSNLLFLLRQEHYPRAETSQYLNLASDELGRITQITAQLLTFHREAQSPVPVDLVKVLQSVLTLYAPQVGMTGIRVTTRYESERPVRGYPGELRQVFANLVSNAIHSMPGGGQLLLHVYESSLTADSQRRGVRVTVLDNGAGIPPEVRKNLFAPFFTTKGVSVSGLGLWVTRGIIEKHEGTIHFTSTLRPGRSGTAFSVFLPFEQVTGKLDLPRAHHS